jgi:GT2 family glycosyltransferase
MPHLYIFTLTWNALDRIAKLKNSLVPSLNNIDYTWLIKDNDSNDHTYDEMCLWGDMNVVPIKYKNNLQNFSEGMNFLFNEASPKDDDLILLLNNDVVFNDTTSITKMMSLLKDDVGVVGSKLLYTNTNKLQHAGVIFENSHHMPIHYRDKEIDDAESEKNRLFQVVTGAVLLMRAGDYRGIFKNASGTCGMDENLRWAFDDVDLCLAVGLNMKKKIVYCGKTNIFHESSASLKKNPVNRLFMTHNVAYLKRKWMKRYKLDGNLYRSNPKYNIYNG